VVFFLHDEVVTHQSVLDRGFAKVTPMENVLRTGIPPVGNASTSITNQQHCGNVIDYGCRTVDGEQLIAAQFVRLIFVHGQGQRGCL
jgi:hypothetical protein